MQKVNVYLKSGKQLEFECDRMAKCETNNILKGFELHETSNGKVLAYINLTEVAAITTEIIEAQ